MKKILSLVILLVSVFIAVNCGCTHSPVGEGGQENNPPRMLKTVPQLEVERAFKEVSIGVSLIDTVSIINSSDELERKIPVEMLDFMRKEGYPNIDFSINSLLFAIGGASTRIIAIEKQLWQTSENEYEVKVVLDLSDVTAPDKWIVALLTDKIREWSNIKLNVVRKEYL